MNRIVVDESVKQQLGAISEPCELVDSAGTKLGFFRPEVDRSVYKGLKPSVSDEELDRRRRQGGGRTLPDIMADLEKLP